MPRLPTISYITPTRTATLNELKSHLTKEVRIAGWISKVRRLKGLEFLILRDGFGKVQVVNTLESVSGGKLHEEDAVEVVGDVREASCDGGMEVVARELKIINRAKQPLPLNLHINATPGREDPTVSTQARDAALKYRYLELRKPSLQHNLRLRAHVSHAMRRFMHESAGFLEVETPTLFKSTPEGAREFLVPVTVEVPEASAATKPAIDAPSRARFFALTQSPQQFKQLLMVGGIDRYFQFARCYRDEGGRADRQSEFTQLDLEMSFIDGATQVQRVVEDAFLAGWNAGVGFFKERGVDLPPSVRRTDEVLQRLLSSSPPPAAHPLSLKFPRMTYQEAMRRFGSDKPDMTFGWELEEEGSQFTIPRLRVSKSEFKRAFEASAANDAKLHYEFTSTGGARIYSKLGSLARGKVLGAVRVKLRQLLLDREIEVDGEKVKEEDIIPTPPFWVEEFPLFEQQGGAALTSCHHPFTAPHPSDASLLESRLLGAANPEDAALPPLINIRGNHFDLVLNGVEIGGGSVRLHSARLQRAVFERALGIPRPEVDAKFGQLLEALGSGAPPHGGFAFGFDRFVSLLAGVRSLSSVIAFPKSTVGNDPMSNAPTPVSDLELKRMGLRNL